MQLRSTASSFSHICKGLTVQCLVCECENFILDHLLNKARVQKSKTWSNVRLFNSASSHAAPFWIISG